MGIDVGAGVAGNNLFIDDILSPSMVAAACALFGLLIGSFLNVVIWRVPRGESVVKPGSHCPTCNTALGALDNVPLLSWLILRGRCRHCAVRIPVRYPAVELVTAAIFAVIGSRFYDSWAIFGYLVLGAGLLALSVIDLDHMLLPNKVIFPTAAIVVVLLGVASVATGDYGQLGRAALCGLIDFAIFYSIWFIAPGAMGFGDVRLSALLGFALGWISWSALWTGMFLPFVLGTIVGIAIAAPLVLVPMFAGAALAWLKGVELLTEITGTAPQDPSRSRIAVSVGAAVMGGAIAYLVLAMIGRVDRGKQIPFGPYLASGALIAVVAL